MSAALATAIGSAAYGHRRQNRQDLSGLVGCVLRHRGLRRRGADGAMAADGTRPTRTEPPLAGAALRKATMAIWCVAFCGLQWRAIGQLCDIPFNTLYTLFARWTRLGLWRRLLDRLRRAWRLACGDTADPSTVVIDSRSCRSAPSCFTRGIDGGKKIRGVKIQVAVDKHGIPLAIDVAPANTHDTKGIVPVLRELASQGFRGPALSDLGYRGKRLAKIAEALGIIVKPVARGRDGKFLPAGMGGGALLRLVEPLPSVE